MNFSPVTIPGWDRFEEAVLDWSSAWGPRLSLLREWRGPFTVCDLGPSPDPLHYVTHVLAIAIEKAS